MGGADGIAEHERLCEHFLRARMFGPAERREYVSSAFPDGGPLRERLDRMLAADERECGVLPRDPEDARLDAAPAALFAASESLRAGDVVGGYRILGTIGEGGMGVVHRAEQERPKRIVALKIIRAPFVSALSRRRFEREISALARFDHDGIARIFEAGAIESPLGRRPFFAMELVEGADLIEHSRRARLPLRGRLALFARVCDAVHHAHQKGVIHRDLKPANVLVDSSGSPKVVDFGVARSVEAAGAGSGAAAHRTLPGDLLGTVAYMSPEQAGGGAGNGLDVRSDVYSLGVVLYELLSDRLPIRVDGRPIPEAVHLVRDAEPEPLDEAAAGVPRDVGLIAAKALAKEKDLRYASAADLAADVRRFLASEPISARRPRALYVFSRFVRRRRAAVAGGALALAALVTAFAVAAGEAVVAARQLVETERLSDTVELREVEDDSERLWPRRPEKIADFDAWLARAERLSARLPLHERSLATARGETSGASPSPFARYRHEKFDDLVARIRALAPRIEEIRDRRRAAVTIASRTVGDHAAEWAAAAAAVAADPRFSGLDLEPLVGLVPLGSDPGSRLSEFWLWESGERPARDDSTGRFVMTGETGIVLVLVPGGRTWVGASRDPAGRNHDPDDSAPALAAREVGLDPYLISKYELTQGQWLRMTGGTPSYHGSEDPNRLSLPVDTVSFDRCCEALARFGLEVPTEAEWERAVRGGTDTPWWTGTDPRAIERAEHIWTDANLGLEDRFRPDPVGRHSPNPFGLFDALGNLWELCRGDELGEPIARPGAFNTTFRVARAAARLPIEPDMPETVIGVRPSMRLRLGAAGGDR